MDRSFFIVVNGEWLIHYGNHPKRLSRQGLCPIGTSIAHLRDSCNLLVKYKDSSGTIVADDAARIQFVGNEVYIKCERLADFVLDRSHRDWYLGFFFEGTSNEARCVVDLWTPAFLSEIEAADPTLRFHAYDLPPMRATLVEESRLRAALYRAASSKEPELFVVHASRFLDAPHIINALFSHLFSITTEDNIRFPIQVKKIAEKLRLLLMHSQSTTRINVVRKSHLELWAEVQGQRFGFVDGGVARIAGLAGVEPMAMRVGVYSVKPGIVAPDKREQWSMQPFVLGDLIDQARLLSERPDSRRFIEAARYTLEPLTGLHHLANNPDTRLLLLHGPLVNQFAQYDEGEPNFLPFIAPRVLQKFGICRENVIARVAHIPHDVRGEPMWNHFMAIYAYVMRSVAESTTPIVGVVERPAGRAVATAVLERLRDDGVINQAAVDRVQRDLERYNITDEFLFGCVLRAGEYLTPVSIQKNLIRRARDRWQPVVRQYPQPFALLIKTEDTNFPFRVEMNEAASARHEFLARFLYHTARLLPRYAFPVGLDIVDKYAKIPDWISRGASTELSAAVLRKAMQTGDPHLVMQVRLRLARGPRDFFFRPSAQEI